MKILTVFCLLVCATTVFAQTTFTPISNLNQPTGGDNIDITSEQRCAISFTTDNTPGFLSGIAVKLIQGNPGSGCPIWGTFNVELYSDKGGSPGNLIEALYGNNYPTNTGVYLYTNAVALRMATNTTYWIVATNSDNTSDSQYKWSTAPEHTLDAGSVWSLEVEKASINGGVWQPVAGLFSLFSITAVSSATSAPPTISISDIALTYPATQFNYVLQENSNLGTTNWVTVTNVVLSGTVSNLAFFILPPAEPHMYYRLNLPP